MKAVVSSVALALVFAGLNDASAQPEKEMNLEMKVREPRIDESVLTYFLFLEEETRKMGNVRIRLVIGSFGLEQLSGLLAKPATELFWTVGADPFVEASTLKSQLEAFVAPMKGSVEIQKGGEILLTEMVPRKAGGD